MHDYIPVLRTPLQALSSAKGAVYSLGPRCGVPFLAQSVNPDHPQEVQFKTPSVETAADLDAAHPGWGERIKEAVGSVFTGTKKVRHCARGLLRARYHRWRCRCGKCAGGLRPHYAPFRASGVLVRHRLNFLLRHPLWREMPTRVFIKSRLRPSYTGTGLHTESISTETHTMTSRPLL